MLLEPSDSWYGLESVCPVSSTAHYKMMTHTHRQRCINHEAVADYEYAHTPAHPRCVSDPGSSRHGGRSYEIPHAESQCDTITSHSSAVTRDRSRAVSLCTEAHESLGVTLCVRMRAHGTGVNRIPQLNDHVQFVWCVSRLIGRYLGSDAWSCSCKLRFAHVVLSALQPSMW